MYDGYPYSVSGKLTKIFLGRKRLLRLAADRLKKLCYYYMISVRQAFLPTLAISPYFHFYISPLCYGLSFPNSLSILYFLFVLYDSLSPKLVKCY